MTSRGAAILAFQAIGLAENIPLPDVVDTADPNPIAGEAYMRAAKRQAGSCILLRKLNQYQENQHDAVQYQYQGQQTD